MEIPEKLREVLKKDGVVAIATLGQDGPHMVNTWNSYVRVTEDGRMLIPAGFMNQTEANVAFNPEVLITLGSSKVAGNMGPGTGFLIKGTAEFVTSGRRLRRSQGDLQLDARRRGRDDALGDADALAAGRYTIARTSSAMLVSPARTLRTPSSRTDSTPLARAAARSSRTGAPSSIMSASSSSSARTSKRPERPR